MCVCVCKQMKENSIWFGVTCNSLTQLHMMLWASKGMMCDLMLELSQTVIKYICVCVSLSLII